MSKWTEEGMKRQQERRRQLVAAGICTYCKRVLATRKQVCDACFAQRSERGRGRLQELRQLVLDRYGRECACCGEKEEGFLTIDHKNNDGWKERVHGAHSGEMMGRSLVFGPKREDIQILCYNCNCAKARLGYCPHRPETRIERRTRGARRRDGEHNSQSRLSLYQVKKIRESSASYAELARRFGVSDVAIRLVKLGKSYRSSMHEVDIKPVAPPADAPVAAGA